MNAVDGLTECPMQKSILHVKLLNRPITICSQGKHHVSDGRFYNRAKSFAIVDLRAFSEAPEKPTGLVIIEGLIREELMCEDPFLGDYVGAIRPRIEFPSIVSHKGCIFFLHGRAPMWISKRGPDRGWNRRWCRRWSSSVGVSDLGVRSVSQPVNLSLRAPAQMG
jgi:hypothetical protein